MALFSSENSISGDTHDKGLILEMIPPPTMETYLPPLAFSPENFSKSQYNRSRQRTIGMLGLESNKYFKYDGKTEDIIGYITMTCLYPTKYKENANLAFILGSFESKIFFAQVYNILGSFPAIYDLSGIDVRAVLLNTAKNHASIVSDNLTKQTLIARGIRNGRIKDWGTLTETPPIHVNRVIDGRLNSTVHIPHSKRQNQMI